MGENKSDEEKRASAKVEDHLREPYADPNAVVCFLSLSDFVAAKKRSCSEYNCKAPARILHKLDKFVGFLAWFAKLRLVQSKGRSSSPWEWVIPTTMRN